MASNKNLLILPGDGIGPEVMSEVRTRHRLDRQEARASRFDVEEDAGRRRCLDKHGVPLTDATMEQALEADAVLLGAVGGPKWDSLPLREEARARPAAPAQGDGALRQPAAGHGVRRAGRCLER